MLLKIESYAQLDERRLMDLYGESNRENADYFYPEMEDKRAALALVEESFLRFLREDFLPKPENTYWVLAEDGVYTAALRLTEVKPREFYLEALETHPDHRRQGRASVLFREVFTALGEEGSFLIRDCVSKKNTASLKCHKKAGFTVADDCGNDPLQGEKRQGEYTMEYRLPRL